MFDVGTFILQSHVSNDQPAFKGYVCINGCIAEMHFCVTFQTIFSATIVCFTCLKISRSRDIVSKRLKTYQLFHRELGTSLCLQSFKTKDTKIAHFPNSGTNHTEWKQTIWCDWRSHLQTGWTGLVFVWLNGSVCVHQYDKQWVTDVCSRERERERATDGYILWQITWLRLIWCVYFRSTGGRTHAPPPLLIWPWPEAWQSAITSQWFIYFGFLENLPFSFPLNPVAATYAQPWRTSLFLLLSFCRHPSSVRHLQKPRSSVSGGKFCLPMKCTIVFSWAAPCRLHCASTTSHGPRSARSAAPGATTQRWSRTICLCVGSSRLNFLITWMIF